ncbi:MAG: ATP-binding cassette domain-containing protein [Xanthomonadales bacterium]|nr:ATP-binding cassette domain-containing protein [Xanthomonadales bacterium]
MIEVQQLRKHFGAVKAVDGVSFKANDGQITGLLGPNGAGKTTTLRMLYTLMKPDSGTVLVDQINAFAESNQARRRLGVLPDARGLYKRLSAAENIEYFGQLHGLEPELIRQRIAQLEQRLDLGEILHRRTEGFSQGQRVKTALARALIHDPPNLLLDEPGNGLDVMSTRALREILRGLRAEGRCVLFSSHMMAEVAAVCDRIVVIAKGKVVADGSADELRELTGTSSLEDAFVKVIGTDEGLAA